MQRFVDSIAKSVETENWFSALFLALAVPDVCGALEDPEAGVGERYRSWFNRYMKRKYDPENLYELVSETSPESLERMPHEAIESLKSMPPNAECAFTASDCYRFRCRCLHQGLSQKMGGEKIHFTAPDKNKAITTHMSSFNGLYQLQIDIFCIDVCNAVKKWAADISGNVEIERRIEELIEIYQLDDPRFPIVKYQ